MVVKQMRRKVSSGQSLGLSVHCGQEGIKREPRRDCSTRRWPSLCVALATPTPPVLVRGSPSGLCADTDWEPPPGMLSFLGIPILVTTQGHLCLLEGHSRFDVRESRAPISRKTRKPSVLRGVRSEERNINIQKFPGELPRGEDARTLTGSHPEPPCAPAPGAATL